MSERLPFTSTDPRELGVLRAFPAARADVWRCWSEPDLLKQWYCPKPWYVSAVEMDLRPGGTCVTTMNGPNGEEHRNPGQYLVVEPHKTLMFTDAFDGDWRPAGKPFMVGVVELSDTPDGGTLMRWSARHWRDEDVEAHRSMGFEAGWNAAADQLAALLVTLKK